MKIKRITTKRRLLASGDVGASEVTLSYNGKWAQYLVVIFDHETKLRFEKKFWNDEVSIMTENAKVFYDASGDPILILENNMNAVLMPIRS